MNFLIIFNFYVTIFLCKYIMKPFKCDNESCNEMLENQLQKLSFMFNHLYNISIL